MARKNFKNGLPSSYQSVKMNPKLKICTAFWLIAFHNFNFFLFIFPAFENVFYLCVLFVYELSFIVSDQIKIFIGMFWR